MCVTKSNENHVLLFYSQIKQEEEEVISHPVGLATIRDFDMEPDYTEEIMEINE